MRFRKLASTARYPRMGAMILVLGVLLIPAPLPAIPAGTAGSPADSSTNLPKWLLEQTMGLDQVGCGELVFRTDDGFVPLPMLNTDISIEVTGVMVHGTVTQEFTNPTPMVIEATYVFPLPERAAVHHMEIRIGQRRIVSEIQEKREAKRTYERARKTGRKAALVEQERPNLFTMSVANINPDERVDVRLEYLEEAAFSDGEFSLVFPLTFTPRFIPDAVLQVRESTGQIEVWSPTVPQADRVAPPFVESTDPTAPTASIRVNLDLGFPLEDVTCTSHEVITEREGDKWRIAPASATILADRDFILRWRIKRGRMPQASLLTEDVSGEDYALLMIVPPHPEAEAGMRLPTKTMFVIDVSGSMAGPSIRRAREALVRALGRLRPVDRFNIMKFNNTSHLFSGDFLAGTPEAVSKAKRWARALEAGGGTMIFPALLGAISEFSRDEDYEGREGYESTGESVERIVFLTDGSVANEAQVLQRITDGLGDIRLHAIGIGYAPNRYLIRRMTTAGHGLHEFISGDEKGENKVDGFFARLESAVMTDLSVTAEGLGLEDVYPDPLPDLHAGEPIVVSARIRQGVDAGTLVLRGRTEQGAVLIPMNIAAGRSESGIATRWARVKVRSLMDSLREGADPAEVRKRVVEVGIAFHIVTRYTSLVAVEETPTASAAANRVKMANALPHGSQLLGGGLPKGGTSAPIHIALGLLLVLSGVLFLIAYRVLSRMEKVGDA